MTLNTSAANGAITLATVNGTTAGAENLTLTAGTGATTLGTTGGTTRLGALQSTTSGAGSTTFNGNVTANSIAVTGAAATGTATLDTSFNNGSITLGALAAGGVTTLNAGTGLATLGAVSHGGNIVTVTADTVSLNGAWSGTGARVLQPTTASRTIGLAGGVGDFALNGTALGFLNGGSPSSVTIGRSNGTGDVAANGFSFDQPLTIRGGDIAITGSLDKSAGQLTLTSTDAITGSVDMAAGTGTFLLTGRTAVLTGSTVNGATGSAAAQQAQVTALSGSTGPFTINGAPIPGAPQPYVPPPPATLNSEINSVVINQIASQTSSGNSLYAGSLGQSGSSLAGSVFSPMPLAGPYVITISPEYKSKESADASNGTKR